MRFSKEPAPAKTFPVIKWRNYIREKSFLISPAFHVERLSNSAGCPKSLPPNMCRLSSKI
jgi:hypothetical protein